MTLSTFLTEAGLGVYVSTLAAQGYDNLQTVRGLDASDFTSNFQVISVVQMIRHGVLAGQIFLMRKDELKTVLLKFDDMLAAAGGGAPDDSSDDEERATLLVGRGRGRGRGQGCGRSGHSAAARSSAPSQRWESRRVKGTAGGALDAARSSCSRPCAKSGRVEFAR